MRELFKILFWVVILGVVIFQTYTIISLRMERDEAEQYAGELQTQLDSLILKYEND